jgi:hypothetical protein
MVKNTFNKNSQNTTGIDVDECFVSQQLNIPSAATDDPVNESVEGDIYFNNTSNEVRVFNGTDWQGTSGPGAYLPLAGGTMTGTLDFQTNVAKLIVPKSNDLPPGQYGEIFLEDMAGGNTNYRLQYHDGTRWLKVPKTESGWFFKLQFGGLSSGPFGDQYYQDVGDFGTTTTTMFFIEASEDPSTTIYCTCGFPDIPFNTIETGALLINNTDGIDRPVIFVTYRPTEINGLLVFKFNVYNPTSLNLMSISDWGMWLRGLSFILNYK